MVQWHTQNLRWRSFWFFFSWLWFRLNSVNKFLFVFAVCTHFAIWQNYFAEMLDLHLIFKQQGQVQSQVAEENGQPKVPSLCKLFGIIFQTKKEKGMVQWYTPNLPHSFFFSYLWFHFNSVNKILEKINHWKLYYRTGIWD